MIVDIVDKYLTDDNNPIKNLRLKICVPNYAKLYSTCGLTVYQVSTISLSIFLDCLLCYTLSLPVTHLWTMSVLLHTVMSGRKGRSSHSCRNSCRLDSIPYSTVLMLFQASSLSERRSLCWLRLVEARYCIRRHMWTNGHSSLQRMTRNK